MRLRARRAIAASLLVVVVVAAGAVGAVPAGESGGASEHHSSGTAGGVTADGAFELEQNLRTTSNTSEANQTTHVQAVVIFENASARESSSLSVFNATVTGGSEIEFLPVLFVRAPEGELAAIEANQSVRTVTRETTLASPSPADRTNETITSETTVPWGIDRINAPAASRRVPAEAQRDVAVAVVDSGIDTAHPALTENVVWGVNTAGESTSFGVETATDARGHGTAVAGIVAADAGGGVRGVAPNVSLYSVRVSGTSPGISVKSLIRGIEWGLRGPDETLGTDDDADVVTISLGSMSQTGVEGDVIAAANEYATVVSSAGNGGDGDPETNTVSYPAKYNEAIAVGATDVDDRPPTFSAEGEEVELAAPGVSIKTTALTRADSPTRLFTGTSAAAPHVAGTAALVHALSDGERSVRAVLQETARDVGAPGRTPTTGYGIVDAEAAVAAVDESTADITYAVSGPVAFHGQPVFAFGGDVVAADTSDSGPAYTLRAVNATENETVAASSPVAAADVTVYEDAVALEAGVSSGARRAVETTGEYDGGAIAVIDTGALATGSYFLGDDTGSLPTAPQTSATFETAPQSITLTASDRASPTVDNGTGAASQTRVTVTSNRDRYWVNSTATGLSTRELFNILTRDAVVPADAFDPETTYTTAEIPPVGQRFANSTYADPFDAYADGHLLEITTGGTDTEAVEVSPAPSVVAAPPSGPLNSDLTHAATGEQLDSGAGIGPFNVLAYAAPTELQSIDTQAPLLVAASGTVAGETSFSDVPAGNYTITLAAHDTEATAEASVTVAGQAAADNGHDSPTDVDAAFIKTVTTDDGEATAATAQQTIAAIRAGEIGPATTREIIDLLRA